jgi:hypothetical protein
MSINGDSRPGSGLTRTGGTTTIIQRPAGDIDGLRSVTDESATLLVRAFPFQATAAVAAVCNLAVAGAYLLTRRDAAYIGESSQLARRLGEHLADPAKGGYDTVYVIHGAHAPIDKSSAVHLQSRLTAAAEGAGLVRIQKGSGAPAGDLPHWRTAPLDAALALATRLLYDAGCRVFCDCPAAPAQQEDPAAAEQDDDDNGAMEVGVSSVPPGVTEMELQYGGLFVRGYEWLEGFVVAAGSEIRVDMNPSVIQRIRERREVLLRTVAAPIGTDGRVRRLTSAVAFPSCAIAGKVMSGAHIGTDKWRPLARAPMVVSG